ncbi:hypothetical protein [Streptomyces pseudogriseolus]|uniref:hypothetical protein n=1 Tax=Streptomyces pseudogriseolus TaxID=36817 RepID=UPI003FA21E30
MTGDDADEATAALETLRSSVPGAFGVRVTETEDGMVIEGAARLRPARVDSHGDHRIAMTAAVVGARGRVDHRDRGLGLGGRPATRGSPRTSCL